MANTEKIIFTTHKMRPSGGQLSVNDKRASKRFSHEAPLIIKNRDGGTYAYGRMYNYSRGGIYFESDIAFRPGTCVRIDIEKSQNSMAANRYYAMVKWCKEISAAVVLYDYAIGIEFDPALNQTAGTGKLRVIQGGPRQDVN